MASMETTSFEQWLEAQGFNKKSINKFIEEDFTQSSELMRLNKDDILSLKLTLAQQKILESLIEPREKQGVIETVESQTKANVEETEEDITTEDMSPMSLTVEDSCQSQQVAEMATDDMETLQAKRETILASEMRLVLLGLTGSGKSATGNTILGKKEFESKLQSSSVTAKCASHQTTISGTVVKVIDVPGFEDTTMDDEDLKIAITSCVVHASPGIHAILFVIRIGRYTEHNEKILAKFLEYFGPDALKFGIAVFSGLDGIEDEETSLEEYIHNSHPALQKFLSLFGNRYIGVNNKKSVNDNFVRNLLTDVCKLMEENGNKMYTTEVLKKADNIMIIASVMAMREGKTDPINITKEEVCRNLVQTTKGIDGGSGRPLGNSWVDTIMDAAKQIFDMVIRSAMTLFAEKK